MTFIDICLLLPLGSLPSISRYYISQDRIGYIAVMELPFWAAYKLPFSFYQELLLSTNPAFTFKMMFYPIPPPLQASGLILNSKILTFSLCIPPSIILQAMWMPPIAQMRVTYQKVQERKTLRWTFSAITPITRCFHSWSSLAILWWVRCACLSVWVVCE